MSGPGDSTRVTVGRAEITSRQLDVLRLVAAGLGNKEIATRIGRTESDVKAVVSRLLLKLQASNRAELAQITARIDLLGESDLAEHEIRELLQLSPVLTMLTRGPDHRVVFANHAYEDTADEGSLVGRTIAEIFPATPVSVERFDRIYLEGVSIRSRGPTTITYPLGSTRTNDLASVLRPLRDQAGRITGVAYVALDLTGAPE